MRRLVPGSASSIAPLAPGCRARIGNAPLSISSAACSWTSGLHSHRAIRTSIRARLPIVWEAIYRRCGPDCNALGLVPVSPEPTRQSVQTGVCSDIGAPPPLRAMRTSRAIRSGNPPNGSPSASTATSCRRYNAGYLRHVPAPFARMTAARCRTSSNPLALTTYSERLESELGTLSSYRNPPGSISCPQMVVLANAYTNRASTTSPTNRAKTM